MPCAVGGSPSVRVGGVDLDASSKVSAGLKGLARFYFPPKIFCYGRRGWGEAGGRQAATRRYAQRLSTDLGVSGNTARGTPGLDSGAGPDASHDPRVNLGSRQ